MSAYELGVLTGSLMMVVLMTYVGTRLLRGTPAGRVIAAVIGVVVIAGMSGRLGCSERRNAQATERAFAKGCERSCRVKNPAIADECGEYCRCSAREARKQRGDAALASWGENGPELDELMELRAQLLATCGREILRKQYTAVCEQSCASEGCVPGACQCMADLLVADARFSDPRWIAAVVLTEEETPELTAWDNAASAKCAPSEGESLEPAAPPP
jgi:hypothetical protein